MLYVYMHTFKFQIGFFYISLLLLRKLQSMVNKNPVGLKPENLGINPGFVV